MNTRYIPGLALLGVLAAGVTAADVVRSGPQPGNSPGPFSPLHCNGPDAGRKADLTERYGSNPVALIFAREVTGPLTTLIKKLDESAVRNRTAHLGAVVVFCSDDEGLENKLKDLARKEGLKQVVLTIDRPAGPQGYDVARDAEVTVILYKRRTVAVNHAFRKGELKDSDADKVLAELETILPEKKEGEKMDLAVYAPKDLKWADAPPVLPRGAKVALLEGDPSKEGPFVMRVRMPDGYKIPPHTHPKPERVTVISGTFYIGMGDKFDETKGKEMPAGSFGTWPAGMKHFVWAEGETVIQLHGTGPWSLTYAYPRDDPRNSGK